MSAEMMITNEFVNIISLYEGKDHISIEEFATILDTVSVIYPEVGKWKAENPADINQFTFLRDVYQKKLQDLVRLSVSLTIRAKAISESDYRGEL